MSDAGPRDYSLSRKEGWLRMVRAPARVQPDYLNATQLGELTPSSRAEYNSARATWHANLGPLATPQMTAIHETLWEIVDSNRQDGDRVKGAVAIDAYPGLGKTTIANAFGRDYHQHSIDLYGERTDDGHERIPVCHVGLTSNTSKKTLNLMLLEFFAHPGQRGNAAQLASRGLDCILSCGTQLVIVDDIHFINPRRKDGLDVSNHLKWLANTFPVTFLFVGVGIREHGLLSEGLVSADAAMAQTARRWTRLEVEAFDVGRDDQRRVWRQLLLAIEQRLVLANAHRGMVADELSDYLYARSSGHIGSLMTLITRGCYRAIRSGEERLSVDLLDRVPNDEGAEKARQELAGALSNGLLTTRPITRRPRRRSGGAAA